MSELKIATRCLQKDLPELLRKVKEDFFTKIEILRQDPSFGKQLWGDLRSFRSLKISRYRAVYYHNC